MKYTYFFPSSLKKIKEKINSRTSILVLAILLPVLADAQVSIVTQHNNNSRTGWNSEEKILNASNVNKSAFGKIGAFQVDDQIYAQPLLVSNLDMPGKGKRNVLFVATVNNTVYAFDAEDMKGGKYFWKVNLIPAGERSVKNTDFTDACNGNYNDFSGNIGIVGTPVIDTIAKTLYCVTKTMERDSICHQRLHALNILDGSERANSPVIIEGSVEGVGSGTENGVVKWRAMTQNQRAALLLSNGLLFVAWGGHCDSGPFHGWVMSFDPLTLRRKEVYNNTRNGHGAGIWMSGQGPSADEDGYIYVTCGNGTTGYNGNVNDSTNLGDSFIKLNAGLEVCDWFTPYNYASLDDHDLDLGSAGSLLIPNTNLLVSGGKEGVVYVVNRKKMGRLNSQQNDNQIVQSFLLRKKPNNIHGSPAYYHGANGEYMYVWAEYDYLRAFKFNRDSGRFTLPAASHSTMPAPDGMPGGMVSVSSNGQLPGTGVVWATHPFSGNANWQTRPGIFRAFDATDVSHELWNSKMDSVRDDLGNFAKFCYPTVANGKVYLATFSNQLVVYGLFEHVNGVSKNQSELLQVELSPVPVSDYLDIKVTTPMDEVEVIVSDLQSRTILQQEWVGEAQNIRLYLGNLDNGIYLVTIRNGETQVVKRVEVFR